MSDQHNDNGDEQQTNTDADNSHLTSSEQDTSSAQDEKKQQFEQAYPEVGYQTAEWDMLKPPDERVVPLTYTNRLKLSEMSVKSDGEMTQYSLFDSEGNTYTQREFDKLPESPDPDRLDATISKTETEDGKPQRLALAELADIATSYPEMAVTTVEPMIALLGDASPAVQGEALGILTSVVDTNPEAVRPAVEPAIDLLSDDTHHLLRNEALQFLVAFTAHDPKPLTETVPRLASLLHDEETDREPVARILSAIARSDPDALVPVVPKLERYLETEPKPAHVWVLGAVGHLSKTHPGIAKETIPIAADLIDAEESVLRSNAAGVLADLADEYPSEVKSIVPRAIELLQDADGNARYNASSILARVAKTHPDAVEPATEQLLGVLDDEMADARFNACWALNYINATAAIEKLTDVATTDSDEDVREVAQMAIDSIED